MRGFPRVWLPVEAKCLVGQAPALAIGVRHWFLSDWARGYVGTTGAFAGDRVLNLSIRTWCRATAIAICVGCSSIRTSRTNAQAIIPHDLRRRAGRLALA